MRSLVAACPAHDLDALTPGHAPVDDGHVVLVPAQLVDGVIAPADGIDPVTGILETEDDDVPKPWFILCDEDPHRVAPCDCIPMLPLRLGSGAARQSRASGGQSAGSGSSVTCSATSGAPSVASPGPGSRRRAPAR